MSPQRIQRKRTKGWRMPVDTIYVGRGTQWGNPWRVGDVVTITTPISETDLYLREMTVTAELAVALYRIAYTPDAPEARVELSGANLACWCPLDKPCHADVLLELANA